MSIFEMYLRLGIQHIADFKGYDHILFLVSLMAVYQFYQWKKILKLITAFTIGHSISLALSALNYVHFSIPIIEFLIPITIILTASVNILNQQKWSPQFYIYEYLITMLFGLIHGLGFSVLLKSLLGSEESIILPLAAFNIGLELGQILIVLVILSLGFIATTFLNLKSKYWSLILSIVAFLVSAFLIATRWPW